MMRGPAILLLLCLASPLAAQTWSHLRGLASGTPIEVVREDHRTFEGTLAAVTENQLTLATSTGKPRFGRSTILRVRTRQQSRSSGLAAALLFWRRAPWTTIYERPRR